MVIFGMGTDSLVARRQISSQIEGGNFALLLQPDCVGTVARENQFWQPNTKPNGMSESDGEVFEHVAS